MVALDWTFLGSLGSFLSGIISCFLVLFNINSIKYSKRTIEEMQATREAESRPYLHAHFIPLISSMRASALIIKNYGKTGAVITEFSTGKNKLPMPEGLKLNLVGAVLAPNQAVTIGMKLMDGPELDAYLSSKFDISIKYKSQQSDLIYSDEIPIDMCSYSYDIHTRSTQRTEEPHEASLRNISVTLQDMYKRM